MASASSETPQLLLLTGALGALLALNPFTGPLMPGVLGLAGSAAALAGAAAWVSQRWLGG